MSINCLIVDDEPLAIEALETLLGKFPGLKITGKCRDSFEAFDTLQKNKVDLMFLDIHMPEVSGLSFLKSLKNPPAVILTTAYRQHALEAFDLDVVDYLVKPVSFERLMQAMNKFYSLQSGPIEKNLKDPTPKEAFILVRAERKVQKVLFDDILYIESLKDYVKIITTEKTIISKIPISHIEKDLPSDAFLRCHRSYIVNINKITAFTKDDLEIGRIEIPIGGSYRHDVENGLTGRGKGQG